MLSLLLALATAAAPQQPTTLDVPVYRDSLYGVSLPRPFFNHAVLDVEEYLVARGGDLILLQFRYPRGLPRDSIAAGYERVFDGIRMVAYPGPDVHSLPTLVTTTFSRV